MVRRRFRSAPPATDIEPQIALWLLRILVPLGGERELMHAHGFSHEAMATALGLGHWIDAWEDLEGMPVLASRSRQTGVAVQEKKEFERKAVKAELRQLYQQAEKEWGQAAPPACLRRNIQQLSELVGLSSTDCRVLEFAVSIHSDRLLDDAADWLGQLSSSKVFHVLATLLQLPEQQIRAALHAQGVLAQSGLLAIDRSGTFALRGKLNLLSDDFADLMLTSEADTVSLLKGMVAAVPPGQLGLQDYGHIQPSLDILQPYLRHATATRRRGVNIFLYGAPGTGKSQLARALAGALGCELFDVACEDADGDPVNGERRLRAFRAAQSFFAQRQALVVFDEVEDVFNDGSSFFGRKSTAQVRKAWINRMLEDNPVPTLWLSNALQGVDPAFIRRFDMVFELPVPPKTQRERILQASCGDVLDASRIARIAEVQALAPAVVAKAGAVVRAIRDELSEGQAGQAFELLVSNTLQAQGHRPLLAHDPSRLPALYDPGFLHADADLALIAEGVKAAKTGRLCLYGPPGTGKTAYGRWVAEQLGVALLVQKASDLMSPYVGENERNIARAFQEAQAEGAVLLIDEVDSFLQDRRGAQRGWEVSLVNEMLTQMESFAGVFIASTNLMEGLDQAALRRFDLKVKFDFLRADQAWALLERHCDALGLVAPTAELQGRLGRLRQLTPGDFAAVVRQHRFRPIASAEAMVRALEGECAVKASTTRAIGFV